MPYIAKLERYRHIVRVTITQYNYSFNLIFTFQSSLCFSFACYREVVTCSDLFLFGVLQLQHAKHNILCVPLCKSGHKADIASLARFI